MILKKEDGEEGKTERETGRGRERERERDRERERERRENNNVREKYLPVSSHMCCDHNVTCNLGMCPEWEWDTHPFVLQDDAPTN